MKPILNSVTVWSGAFMIILVLAGAFAFTFTDLMTEKLYGGKRTGFIVMLFAYALYRGFRLYQTLKYKSKDEE
ncbi:MAG: hypothetical protein H0U95_14815 [Bacteroidetes bacterium]|nr:hypothetical protein [Bacteroidota bacterium]